MWNIDKPITIGKQDDPITGMVPFGGIGEIMWDTHKYLRWLLPTIIKIFKPRVEPKDQTLIVFKKNSIYQLKPEMNFEKVKRRYSKLKKV